MSFQDCSVVFHGSPQGILYTGQQITGAFRIKQDEPREIRGLYFKVTGKTKTQWSKSLGSGKNRQTTNYSGGEMSLDTGNLTLLGGYPRQSNGSVIIEAGLSTFDFSFILPPGLPSSFEGIYGNTRYKMKVTVERNNKFDKTKKISLIVICSTDLNLNLENRMPIHRVVTKDFSSLFFDNGTLDMTIDLPMSGYVPGQQLPIKCLVKNKSRVFIESVVFCLENNVTYNTSHPNGYNKTEKQKKVIFTGHKVEKDSESLLDVALSIPAIPASRHVDSLITIQYFVKVKVVVPGMHSNLKIQIPVNIGTIPVYTQNFANPSTVAHFKPQHLEDPAIAFNPSCLDPPQAPCPNSSGFVTPGPQSSPEGPVRDTRACGLPTYQEAKRMAKTTKESTEDGDRGADRSPGNSGDYHTKTYPWI